LITERPEILAGHSPFFTHENRLLRRKEAEQMNKTPDYVHESYLFYSFTMDKLNGELHRILDLPLGEQAEPLRELKKHVCLLRAKNPHAFTILSGFIETVDATTQAPAEIGGGGKKIKKAFKFAIPLDEIDNKKWSKKLLGYAYAELKMHSTRKKYKNNTLLDGINEARYDNYRRIKISDDKIDSTYVAFKVLKPMT
jgi:hypothetical protein